jgi:hypothetical protein
MTDINYANLTELLQLIRDINTKYYTTAISNIIYLEELSDTIYVAYLTSLKDAYDHLVQILAKEDVLVHDNKHRIIKDLDRYAEHLKRIVFDTYRKIVDITVRNLLNIALERDRPALKTQIAEKIKQLRIVDTSLSNEKRIEGYRDLMDFVEAAIRKYSK